MLFKTSLGEGLSGGLRRGERSGNDFKSDEIGYFDEEKRDGGKGEVVT
jgi:hypothetical protein